MNRLVLISLPMLISACSIFDERYEIAGPTLAELQPITLPEEHTAIPRVSAPELSTIYRGLLEQQTTPETRLQISHRLADIEMAAAEEQLAADAARSELFVGAIEAYEALLEDYPNYHKRDQILYQLSKAHDLNGNSEASRHQLQRLAATTPNSNYLTEAEFRRAERAFAEAEYAQAEQLYSTVIDRGIDTRYFTRALYMQGWSRYKQADYPAAIDSFTANLDQLVPQEDSMENLDRANRELVSDSLRVLALALGQLDGAATLASMSDSSQQRSYDYLLYQSLGELYLSQERYRDSAETYRSFINAFPRSRWSHQFQIQVITAYQAGGFADLILTAKKEYVSAYAVSGDYWRISDPVTRANMRENLGTFLEELAGHYHAAAQSLRKSNAEPGLTNQNYALAAQYYEAYLQSFPQDSDAPRLAFLLAESLYESGNYTQAIERYEQVAYTYKDAQHAADAAYTAILAYDRIAPPKTSQQQETLDRDRIDAQIRFFQAFQQDGRATQVLAHAADTLFRRKSYEESLAAASALAEHSLALDLQAHQSALLLRAHNLFELERYSQAEAAYILAMQSLPANDPRKADSSERLAAAIYRQAEGIASEGKHLAAARLFSRVMEVTPSAGVRLNAQYDAAAAFTRAGDLAQANTLLLDFRTRYPAHELSVGIAATLVKNYEQLEQWQDAAHELDYLRSNAATATKSAEALLIAAQYYEKSGDTDNAIARYSSFAKAQSQPLIERLEVMHRLTGLLSAAQQTTEAHAWMDEIVMAHDAAGDEQSPRSAYLAALASSELAAPYYNSFQAIDLRQPLAAALREKKRAMEKALAWYAKCNSYAVEEFSTLASFRIADLYHRLSNDLLASERPPALDPLALEQYDLLLEEQAYPFEEKAIAAHESNIKRSHNGVYDDWVKQSYNALAQLLPARYQKLETTSQAPSDSSGGFFERRALSKLRRINEGAITLREEGQFSAAEDTYLAALELREEYAPTHRNLGILYDLYVGDPTRALQHYSRYQALTGGEDRAMAGWIVDLQRQHKRRKKEEI